MCFTDMFAFSAKQSPARDPAVLFAIRKSTSFAWSRASSFSCRKMFRSFVSGVAIFLENCITFSTAVSFPCWICFSFVFSVILFLRFRNLVRLIVYICGLIL